MPRSKGAQFSPESEASTTFPCFIHQLYFSLLSACLSCWYAANSDFVVYTTSNLHFLNSPIELKPFHLATGTCRFRQDYERRIRTSWCIMYMYLTNAALSNRLVQSWERTLTATYKGHRPICLEAQTRRLQWLSAVQFKSANIKVARTQWPGPLVSPFATACHTALLNTCYS